MYQQIKQILLQYGYEEITLNTGDIYLALRQERGEGYAVVTLDEMGGNKLGARQFYHVSEQIREFLQARGCYRCRFLYLLVTEDDSSVGRLFRDYESYWRKCFWRIQPSKGQVMVYEDEDEAFMVLRDPLENLFASYGTHQNYYEGASQGYQGAGKNGYGQFQPGRFRGRALPWCNIIIILVNVLVFLYMDFFNPFSANALTEAGGLGWQQVLEEGQWYRMISCMFLHAGGEHLFNNMLVLGYIGSCLESAIGSIRYGILYIGSGLLAGITSMVYNMVQNDYVLSVGASGAIFGTVGAMLFLVVFHKGKKAQYSVRQIVWMAFLSLYGGFASQGVDNAAHFGGFVAGFLLAGLLTMGSWPDCIK